MRSTARSGSARWHGRGSTAKPSWAKTQLLPRAVLGGRWFPGLVVDRFNDVLVAETLSVGMEQLKPVIFPVLLEVLAEDGVSIRGLYERNDVASAPGGAGGKQGLV